MVEKSFNDRISELMRALTVIRRDVNGFLSTGDDSYLLSISGQVRSLICTSYSGEKNKNLHPLLVELAQQSDYRLILYAMPMNFEDLPNVPIYVTHCNSIWSHVQQPGMKRFELVEWINADRMFVDYKSKLISPNRMIRAIADKDGGSHYDPDSEESDCLNRQEYMHKSFSIKGSSFFIADIGILTNFLGSQYLNSLHLNDQDDRSEKLTDCSLIAEIMSCKNKLRNLAMGHIKMSIRNDQIRELNQENKKYKIVIKGVNELNQEKIVGEKIVNKTQK